MIDLLKAKQVFQDYVEEFDKNEPKNQLKMRHTYQVAEMSRYIATKLQLSEEDIKLAELIGILHDIGRFEQLEQYSSFDDSKNVDHANLGVSILFDSGLIREFVQEENHDFIIQKAIRNHNKYQIEEGLSQRELLYTKIIRDADKADNFYVKAYVDFRVQYGKEQIGDQTISDKVYQAIQDHHCVLLKDRKTNMDEWISYLAWVFDFNFSVSLKWIVEKGYLDILLNRINYTNVETREKMKIIEKEIMEYVQNAIKE